MLELLSMVWGLVTSLLSWGFDLCVLVLGFAGEVLLHLHTAMPRAEGLVVGVTLAWLLMRRDKHPLLRVLSAPLKLVLDILDLAWDQVVEVVSDVLGVVKSWVKKVVGLCVGSVKGVWSRLLGSLGGLRDRLKKG